MCYCKYPTAKYYSSFRAAQSFISYKFDYFPNLHNSHVYRVYTVGSSLDWSEYRCHRIEAIIWIAAHQLSVTNQHDGTVHHKYCCFIFMYKKSIPNSC